MIKIVKLPITLFLLLNIVLEIFSQPITNLKVGQKEIFREYNGDHGFNPKNLFQLERGLFKRDVEMVNGPFKVDIQRFHEYFREVVGDVKKKISDYVDESTSTLKKLKIEAEKNIREAEIKAVDGINQNRKKAEDDIHQNKITAAMKIQEVSDKMVAHISSQVDDSTKAAAKVIREVELKLDEFLKSYRYEAQKKHQNNSKN